MPWWGWLGIGFGAGIAVSVLVILAWARRFERSWDRAWGWR